jgi:hypothetical protein
MSDLKSSVVKGMLKAAQEVFGANAYVGNDSDKYLTGIALKHISLRWLFDSNVFPVSKMLLLYGAPRQQKSTLAYEFLRMFGEAGAVLAYVENEGGKYSPDLFKSFLRPYLDDMLIMHPISVEEAQSALNMMKKQVQGASDKRELLSCFVLDSLFGTSAEEKHEMLRKEDHAGRAHPAEALLWSSFLQTYVSEFMGWPMSFIVTNHMKVDTSAARRPFAGQQFRVPGGDTQRFAASIAIKVARAERPESRANLAFEGKVVECSNSCLPVYLHTDKSSIGQDHRSIMTEMVWWRTDEGQHTFFDWYACDIRHLAACQMGGEKAPIVPNRDMIRDICDLTVARGRYSSKVLGVEGVTDHEAGWILQQKPEVTVQLDKALGIAQHPVFDGKMPSAIAEASKRRKAKKAEDGDAGILES